LRDVPRSNLRTQAAARPHTFDEIDASNWSTLNPLADWLRADPGTARRPQPEINSCRAPRHERTALPHLVTRLEAQLADPHVPDDVPPLSRRDAGRRIPDDEYDDQQSAE
jgi:hypothetical protein